MKEFIVDEDFHPDVRGYPELVRCKDCKHHGTMDCPMCEEANMPFYTADNWYCYDGDREE